MKTLSTFLFLFSAFLAEAQISSNTTDTTKVAITITPAGFHGRSNGLIDTTNVALGAKANSSTNDLYARYNNTMLGIKALNNNMLGIDNLAMGNNIMQYPVKTSYNTIIGVDARSVNSDGDYITSIGYSSIVNSSSVTLDENSAYGANAMKKGAGQKYNTVIGVNALLDNNNSYNSTIVGSNVMFSNTYGYGNTVVGSDALYTSTYTIDNSSIGSQNFRMSSSAASSVGIGAFVLDSVWNANGITGVGAEALLGLSNGHNNVAIGYKALVVAQKSKKNIAIGANTLLKSTEGEDNVAIGVEALRSITTSRNNVAVGFNALYSHNGLGFIGFNVAVGYKAIFSSTNSDYLTAVGTLAINSSTTGLYNSALGFRVLTANTTGTRNLAVGNKALTNNTTGGFNVAVGAKALTNNVSGSQNVAIGIATLHANTQGFYNTAVGDSALYSYAADSNYNVAVGKRAGYTLASSRYNLFLGSYTDVTGNFNNANAIGAHAIVNARNKVRIGDSNVTVIEGQVPFSNVSDQRLKENIVYTSRLGLDFIMGLQSASYQYKTDKTHIRYDGFIAQDIEKMMQDLNIPFSGLKKSEDGTYSLAYSDFIIPLVNARKAQQAKLTDLKKELKEVQNELVALLQKLGATEEIKAEISLLKISDK